MVDVFKEIKKLAKEITHKLAKENKTNLRFGFKRKKKLGKKFEGGDVAGLVWEIKEPEGLIKSIPLVEIHIFDLDPTHVSIGTWIKQDIGYDNLHKSFEKLLKKHKKDFLNIFKRVSKNAKITHFDIERPETRGGF